MKELYEDNRPPTFPPLLRGQAVPAAIDPFAKAVMAAMEGMDPGLVVWSQAETHLRLAVLFAPERPLDAAMGGLFALALGFADALGALGPPELTVHTVWPNRFKVNAALCGHLRAAASTRDAKAEADWLVVGIEVPILFVSAREPGETPDETTLSEEGCADLVVARLIESVSRHMLLWLSRFEAEGLAPLHKTWTQKCDTLGQEVTAPLPGVGTGLFMGLDEMGNMLFRDSTGTRALPLTDMLEMTP